MEGVGGGGWTTASCHINGTESFDQEQSKQGGQRRNGATEVMPALFASAPHVQEFV